MISCKMTMGGAWRLLSLAVLLVGVPALAQESRDLGFDIDISLSPAAEARLAATHEGISLSAAYYGTPRPGHENQANEAGLLDLGSEDIDLPDDMRSARVTGGTVDAERLRLIDGGAMVNVNVFSSRRHDDDNILDCDFIDGAVSDLASRPVHLRCFLISEDQQTEIRP